MGRTPQTRDENAGEFILPVQTMPFLLYAIFALWWAVPVMRAAGENRGLGVGLLVVGLAVTWAPVWLSVPRIRVGAQGIDCRHLGFLGRSTHYLLSEVDRAVPVSFGARRGLAILLRSGEAVVFGPWMFVVDRNAAAARVREVTQKIEALRRAVGDEAAGIGPPGER